MWLLQQAGKASGRDTAWGVNRERIPQETGSLVTSTYYTISTIFVKVNISIVVSMRWQRGGSATSGQFGISGTEDVQSSTDSAAKKAVARNWDSAGVRSALAPFASSPRLRP